MAGEACAFWRIEEVYSVEQGQWREVGREHVTEPELVIERVGVAGGG
jgi:hypothetical protein